MGLEMVELVMEIEERYAITLREEDAEEIETFGQFVTYVHQRMRETHNILPEDLNEKIVSAALVERLRTLVPDGVEVSQETRMEVLAPALKRDETNVWKYLTERFPELSDWDEYCPAKGCAGSILFFAVMAVWLTSVSFLAGLCLGVVTVLIWWFFYTNRVFGKNLGEIAREVVEKRQRLLRDKELSLEELEDEMRVIFCEQLGLNPEKVRWESRLVKDLGLG